MAANLEQRGLTLYMLGLSMRGQLDMKLSNWNTSRGFRYITGLG